MKTFEIYGGKAEVQAVRLKTNKRGQMKGYWRYYPKKLKNGHIVQVKRYVKPYKRSLNGIIRRIIVK